MAEGSYIGSSRRTMTFCLSLKVRNFPRENIAVWIDIPMN